jgi:hypothetical protein
LIDLPVRGRRTIHLLRKRRMLHLLVKGRWTHQVMRMRRRRRRRRRRRTHLPMRRRTMDLSVEKEDSSGDEEDDASVGGEKEDLSADDEDEVETSSSTDEDDNSTTSQTDYSSTGIDTETSAGSFPGGQEHIKNTGQSRKRKYEEAEPVRHVPKKKLDRQEKIERRELALLKATPDKGFYGTIITDPKYVAMARAISASRKYVCKKRLVFFTDGCTLKRRRGGAAVVYRLPDGNWMDRLFHLPSPQHHLG